MEETVLYWTVITTPTTTTTNTTTTTTTTTENNRLHKAYVDHPTEDKKAARWDDLLIGIADSRPSGAP
nr:unnamed protein product [Spirometra erinaceieuropaei]